MDVNYILQGHELSMAYLSNDQYFKIQSMHIHSFNQHFRYFHRPFVPKIPCHFSQRDSVLDFQAKGPNKNLNERLEKLFSLKEWTKIDYCPFRKARNFLFPLQCCQMVCFALPLSDFPHEERAKNLNEKLNIILFYRYTRDRM